ASSAPAGASGDAFGGAGAAAVAASPADEPPIVGVSVRFWRGDRADLDRAAAALAALAGRRSVRLRMLPFHHGSDEDASRYVMERLGRLGAQAELAPAHEAPQAMLREVDRCALMFGMRLHSLIYAANREVPLLGLSYDPKIDQFLGRLGEQPIGTTEALDPEAFAERAASLLDHPGQWRAAKADAIHRLKAEAVRPAERIVEFLINRAISSQSR
ncbi:polysaccharide pyruvyl transferase family protein, partial [Cohnella lubricantis]